MKNLNLWIFIGKPIAQCSTVICRPIINKKDFHILIGLCDQGIHTFFQIFCRIINRYNNTYFIIFFTVHPDYISGYILILQQVIKILLYLTHYINSVKFLYFIPIADKFL